MLSGFGAAGPLGALAVGVASLMVQQLIAPSEGSFKRQYLAAARKTFKVLEDQMRPNLRDRFQM